MKIGRGGIVFLVAVGASNAAWANDGGEVFRRNCEACHGGWGGYGAPGTGNYDAWRPSLKRGPEEMFAAVRDGRSSMPPRGGNPTLSDEDLRRAVQWLVKEITGD